MGKYWRWSSEEIDVLQYSVGFAKAPPPPLFKHDLIASADVALSGRCTKWSRCANLPFASRLCMNARRLFIDSSGKRDMSLIPMGLKMFSLKYSSRDLFVTRSMRMPAQSILTYVFRQSACNRYLRGAFIRKRKESLFLHHIPTLHRADGREAV